MSRPLEFFSLFLSFIYLAYSLEGSKLLIQQIRNIPVAAHSLSLLLPCSAFIYPTFPFSISPAASYP